MNVVVNVYCTVWTDSLYKVDYVQSLVWTDSLYKVDYVQSLKG